MPLWCSTGSTTSVTRTAAVRPAAGSSARRCMRPIRPAPTRASSTTPSVTADRMSVPMPTRRRRREDRPGLRETLRGWPVTPRPCHPAERELTEWPFGGCGRPAAGADLRRRPEACRRRPRHHGLGDGVASGGPTAVRRVDPRGARPERPRSGRRAGRALRAAAVTSRTSARPCVPAGGVGCGTRRAQHGRVHRATGRGRRARALPTAGTRRRWPALPPATRGRQRRRRAQGHPRAGDRAG